MAEENELTNYPSLKAHEFKSMICNRSIEGAYKNITMNHICDRIDIGYAIYDLDPDNGELEVGDRSSHPKKIVAPKMIFTHNRCFLV